MKPVNNLESKYRVTILARKEWTRSPGTPRVVKRLVWYTDGSRTAEAWVYGQSVNRRLSIPLGKHATVFQAEVYAILACVHEIELRIDQRNTSAFALIGGSESASSCQDVSFGTSVPADVNDISARHAVRLYWVSGHAEVRGNEIADRLARSGSGQRFIGPEPFLGVSRQNIRRKMKRWMKNQHLALWRGPCSTQR